MVEINNRKAKYDYELFDSYEAGIELTGTEIKSIRQGNCNLKDSYVVIRNEEAYIINMYISEYKEGNIFNHDETRTRKLLLHKNEILKLNDKININGFTLIPVKLYFKKNRAKLQISLARGKKTYDKRQSIKERDINRDLQKRLKGN